MSLPGTLSDDLNEVWLAMQDAELDAPQSEEAQRNELDVRMAAKLHAALNAADVNAVARLVVEICNPNAMIFGEPLLYRAAALGQEQTFRTLLAYGACIGARSRTGATIVHAAVTGFTQHILKTVLPWGLPVDDAACGMTPLQCLYAEFQRRQTKMPWDDFRDDFSRLLRLLVAHGANPNQIVLGKTTPLIYALLNGDFDALYLICGSAQVDPNFCGTDGCTPLCVASRLDPDRFETVLKITRDVNARCAAGHTALYTACETKKYSHVLWLISAGARADASARSPLLVCANAVPLDVATALINAGAPIDEMDADSGDTALHVAITTRNTPLAVLLVAVRANLTLHNNKGETPLTIFDEISQLHREMPDLFECAATHVVVQENMHFLRSLLSATPQYVGSNDLYGNRELFQRLEWLVIQQRIFDVCTALQPLELPTLVLMIIVDEIIPFGDRLRMGRKWDAIVVVRHFHERNRMASTTVRKLLDSHSVIQ